LKRSGFSEKREAGELFQTVFNGDQKKHSRVQIVFGADRIRKNPDFSKQRFLEFTGQIRKSSLSV
jgi:hypothetical protein